MSKVTPGKDSETFVPNFGHKSRLHYDARKVVILDYHYKNKRFAIKPVLGQFHVKSLRTRRTSRMRSYVHELLWRFTKKLKKSP